MSDTYDEKYLENLRVFGDDLTIEESDQVYRLGGVTHRNVRAMLETARKTAITDGRSSSECLKQLIDNRQLIDQNVKKYDYDEAHEMNGYDEDGNLIRKLYGEYDDCYGVPQKDSSADLCNEAALRIEYLEALLQNKENEIAGLQRRQMHAPVRRTVSSAGSADDQIRINSEAELFKELMLLIDANAVSRMITRKQAFSEFLERHMK